MVHRDPAQGARGDLDHTTTPVTDVPGRRPGVRPTRGPKPGPMETTETTPGPTTRTREERDVGSGDGTRGGW